MDIRALADGIQIIDTERSTVGMSIPLRCTLMRLSDGSWLMHSPLAFDDATAIKIGSLGKISVIVAPSGLHYLYAGAAWQRWPNAQLWAARPVGKKAPKLSPSKWFVDDAWPYGNDVAAFTLLGTKAEETLLLHRASGSLVVTDLVFNIQQPKGILTKLAYRAFGTYRKFASSRLFKGFIFDKQMFRMALLPVFSEDFKRIVMTHGDVLEGDDVRERLQDATRFLCE